VVEEIVVEWCNVVEWSVGECVVGEVEGKGGEWSGVWWSEVLCCVV
jgi:hypothetical protein